MSNLPTNSVDIQGFDGLTMSSREIAELTGKQHQHVKRDIEKMLKDIGLEDASKFGHIYLDERNRKQTEFRLPKDLTLTLITGYRADLRYKIVKRLEELEDPTSRAIGPSRRSCAKTAIACRCSTPMRSAGWPPVSVACEISASARCRTRGSDSSTPTPSPSCRKSQTCLDYQEYPWFITGFGWLQPASSISSSS